MRLHLTDESSKQPLCDKYNEWFTINMLKWDWLYLQINIVNSHGIRHIATKNAKNVYIADSNLNTKFICLFGQVPPEGVS